MQLELGQTTLEQKKQQEKPRQVLTKREMEICKFLLEMKFSSIDEIHKKFFKITLSGDESNSHRFAFTRLQGLENLGMIAPQNHFKFLKRFYLPTLKAYHLVKNELDIESTPYPSKNIDIRTFEHDLKVLELRLHLESTSQMTSWISDRLLRCLKEYSYLAKINLVPDGIFTLPNGQKVCFEYEKARKSKERYHNKIKHYVTVMRDHNSQQKLFDRVLYVCEKRPVYEYLQNETKIYGELFKVQTSEEFLNTKAGI